MMNLIEELDQFIKTTKEAQEITRALAVKLSLQRKPAREIQELLQVSQGFISQWKNSVLFEGVESLRLQYKGTSGYLNNQEKESVIQWLRSQEYLRIEDLQLHLEREYNVVFASKQSYYNICHEAGISWKKSQKKNPAKIEELVAAKKKMIVEYLANHQEDISTGKLAVFMIDECHLLWGDLLGYVWGKTDMRVEVPIRNQKERQTYYGALDYQTKEFIVQGYDAGNTENTIQFLKKLQQARPNQKIAIFWDGATYHRSRDFQAYLRELNLGLAEEEWSITCFRFAPNAPEQNPVEDIWLQVKNFLRKFYHLCPSFTTVKWLFEFFADGQVFDFPKIYDYAPFAQPI
jgi:transposase